MKNKILYLFIAIALGGTFNAQTNAAVSEDLMVVTDDFKKVDSSELTPQVVEQILKEYPTSKLAAVYKNNKGQFKLIMVLQSGTRRTVYIDVYGRWLNMK
ncbi:hypothetical protein [uncultured Croceitalea sp.]|uniref:hypothetical protein n=1 Tax=uncultured Croceitalea sp. TaxID=1798908 RepID=UPI0033067C50